MASISCSICSSATSGSRRGDLEAAVLAQLGLRKHADLDRELERLPLRGQLAEVELGIADGHDPGALDRVGVPARERVADGFLEHGLAPDALDHQRRGHLPAAKAGELQLAPELARLALQPALHLAGGNLHLQAHARVAELGDRRLQLGRLGRWPGRGCRASARFGSECLTVRRHHATIPCRRCIPSVRAPYAPAGARDVAVDRSAGHLVGGSLDFAAALARYLRVRARRRRPHTAGGGRRFEADGLDANAPADARARGRASGG